MRTSRTLTLSAFALALALSACSAPAAVPGSGQETAKETAAAGGSAIGDGHGAKAGASEVAEPQLHLLTVGQAGEVGMLDLADETWRNAGTLPGTKSGTTDGRYIFASSPEQGTVTVLDSGVWTWDHEDHFHYYRSDPKTVGVITGQGKAVVTPGASATGVFFPETGKGVLLSNDGLAEGQIRETAHLDAAPHQGMLVPLGDFALATVPGAGGKAQAVQAYDGEGSALDGAQAACADAQGTITTRVGVVIGCADGALLATVENGKVAFEHIPYPEGAGAGPATVFRAREGRPTVAAVAGDQGAWILDTRERSWQLIKTDVPLQQVAAVDDKEGHAVALSIDGRILVLSAETGATLSSTEPLLAKTLSDPGLLASVELVADQQRAYLNAPAEQKLYEIDFADNARLARTFPTPSVPVVFARTGR
ncbi:ABC transporter [Arthrobacter sp. CDRTa11]|uniref:ABC transporter n=1 Tax=Arthrobacter sp. CDRTa11 TaxID=2651199 RepID=UPI002265E1D6|nr:ABC transporter [Arthrobacter sp. CDRTa11]UZX03150.1 ABC transporter [Arthrobacter sp. CDRTa11]